VGLKMCVECDYYRGIMIRCPICGYGLGYPKNLEGLEETDISDVDEMSGDYHKFIDG